MSLKEEIKLLKQSKKQQHDPKSEMYKQEHGFCVSWGPTRKYPTNRHHQLDRTNHENFVKLWRAIENTTGLQSDLAGQVINLNKKRFRKETFKLLNKNLNFVPTQTDFGKTTLDKDLKIFTDVLNSKPI